MSATDTSPLDALLSLPPVAALGAPWRRALEQAAGPEPLAESVLVELGDTLGSLTRLSADGDVLLAAILHDLPAWRTRIEPQLVKQWPTVATLLEGQRAAAQVWTLHATGAGGRNAEGLRRLLLVMVKDLRVVPILLARQLAQMHAAGKRPEAERRALAQLTRDIHAPLANRLGIWQLKWELEDLAFRHLEPETYQKIARALDEKRGDRERYIEQVKRELGKALKSQGVEAEVAGRPLDLTPTEFGLLATLAARPGRIFTRSQLLDALRGITVESYERSIDTHVKNLRHKLEPDQRQPRYILTVYGVGYRFADDRDDT